MKQYTNPDFEAIEYFIANGASIVPYFDSKAVPKDFSWSKGNMRLTDMDDIRDRNWYRNQGMALVFNTASCVMVDIDNLLPMMIFEMKQLGMTVLEFRKHKKREWKSMDDNLRDQMLLSEAQKADNAVPAHAVIPSSSGKGLHFYYHVRDTMDICLGHTNIEIFGNRRLAFVTEWEPLKGFFESPVQETAKIRNYWKPIIDGLSDLKKLKKSGATRTPVPFYHGTTKIDYEKYAANTNYGAISEANMCFMWFFKAYQLGDLDGINDCRLYFTGRLNADKIGRAENGAQKFAMRHPDRNTPRYDAMANYKRQTK